MLEYLPYFYAAVAGGAVASVGAATVHQWNLKKRERTIKAATAALKYLRGGPNSDDEAAKAAAQAALEAKLLEQFKAEAAKLQ